MKANPKVITATIMISKASNIEYSCIIFVKISLLFILGFSWPFDTSCIAKGIEKIGKAEVC